MYPEVVGVRRLVRRLMSGLGVGLVILGALAALLALYQLFGTTLFEARSQAALRQHLSTQLASRPKSPPLPAAGARAPRGRSSSTPAAGRSDAPASPSPGATRYGPPPPRGSAVALLQIPAIDVNKAVVEGVAEADLAEGPGHYPGTPLPGQAGNAAIAGHRTTFGGPFYSLNRLRAGDLILVTTRQGSFRYRVQRLFRVLPTDVSIIAPTRAAMLTLTTCAPRFSARERLVVQATLVGTALPAPGWAWELGGAAGPQHAKGASPGAASGTVSGRSGALAGSGAATSGAALVLASGRGGAWPPTLAWGAAEAALGIAAWRMLRRSRRARTRVAISVTSAAVLLVVLFFFFEHVSPLLPANL